MTALPKISVNIPLIAGGDPGIVLDSLKKVEYPPNRYEIIIVEGNHLTKQRNRGIVISKGEIIYLLDDDSQIHPKAFKILAKEFSDPKVAAVGGPSLTPSSKGNYLNNLVGYTLETYFGATRMRYRYSRQLNKAVSEYQLIGANLALRKNILKETGLFDERFPKKNDETDLLRRLNGKKYKLKYNQSLTIFRNQRKNLKLVAQQFFQYGRGRTKQIRYNPKAEDVVFIIPIGFLIYLLSLIFFHPSWYFLPIYFYFILGAATAAKAFIKYQKPSLLITMPLIFPIIHLSYALGLLSELVNESKDEDRLIKIKTRIFKRFSSPQ